ncbi:RNA helicase [Entamoeba marina]
MSNNEDDEQRKRILSRREYLPKREFQKLRLLRDEIEEEQQLFNPEELTESERIQLQQKIQTYNLAKQRIATSQITTPQYSLPKAGDVSYNIQEDEDEENNLEAPKDTSLLPKPIDVRIQQQDDEFERELLKENNDEVEQRILELRAQLIDAPKIKSKAEILSEVRKSLPVYNKRDEFLQLVRKNQVVIVAGETGSGKTTQLPQYLYEDGYGKTGKIACTQPRRVAAMSVARRVAEEVGTRLGALVGYTIRFEDITSDRTIIQYMTDGMLLRAFLTSPDLSDYSVIMIDEAHERTIATDVLLGLLKDIVRFRNDLHVIIASATLDTKKFSEYFDDAPIFEVHGRKFPVTIDYISEPEPDPLSAAVSTVLKIHTTLPAGDILVDIQSKIFIPTPSGARKVVVATNIAETSLTVDGIVYVVDSGYCKLNQYNSRTGLESLNITAISKASADQRAGRAGRVSPGICFRLYTQDAFLRELPSSTAPELIRANLSGVVLLLKTLGIDDILHFDFLDAPAPEAMMRALEELYALGSFTENGALTRRGMQMAEFPLPPPLARVIIAAETFHCTHDIAKICAMLQVSSEIFYRPKEKAQLADTAKKGFIRNEGDHLTLLGVYNSWVEAGKSDIWCKDNFLQARALNRADDIIEQLLGLMERVDIQLFDAENNAQILKALLSAQLTKQGVYRQNRQNRTVEIHPSSVLFGKAPRWILYYELVLTTKEYVRQVSEIDPSWLVEVAPHVFKEEDMKEIIRKYKQTKKKTLNYMD